MKTKLTKLEIALGFSALVFLLVSLFGLHRYEQLRQELQFWKHTHYIEEVK